MWFGLVLDFIEAHLHRYVNEFSYRHTVRQSDTIDCIAGTIDGMIGRRLSYEELTV